jgi:hypothetical protein
MHADIVSPNSSMDKPRQGPCVCSSAARDRSVLLKPGRMRRAFAAATPRGPQAPRWHYVSADSRLRRSGVIARTARPWPSSRLLTVRRYGRSPIADPASVCRSARKAPEGSQTRCRPVRTGSALRSRARLPKFWICRGRKERAVATFAHLEESGAPIQTAAELIHALIRRGGAGQ